MADAGQSPPTSVNDAGPPKVFTRVIAIPPGPPWRQSKMADLEARQSAPLPLSEVAYRLKRLNAWDGGAARFAAFYVRSATFTESFIAEAQVDGEAVKMRMAHPAEERRRTARLGTLALASSVVIILLAAGLTMATAQRARLSETLDTAERQASSRLRQAQAIQRRTREAALLETASAQDTTIDAVIADINWVGANRAPDARIQAFHWQAGALAVEAQGQNPPIEGADRPLLRSAKPIRPGVWAWAAAQPEPIHPALPGPVTSRFR